MLNQTPPFLNHFSLIYMVFLIFTLKKKTKKKTNKQKKKHEENILAQEREKQVLLFNCIFKGRYRECTFKA